MSQVQLLVSSEDVENYKQIKTDLDELRLLVEKSELWVYKGRSASPISIHITRPGIKKRQSKMPTGENPDQVNEHKKVDARMSESSSGPVCLSFLMHCY